MKSYVCTFRAHIFLSHAGIPQCIVNKLLLTSMLGVEREGMYGKGMGKGETRGWEARSINITLKMVVKFVYYFCQSSSKVIGKRRFSSLV